MFRVKKLKSRKELRDYIATYLIGPLLKGQSTTLACALRRTLLSEVEGVSPIGVAIPNVMHEYNNIPGVKEDMIDILLNIKQLVFKIFGEDIPKMCCVTLNVRRSQIKSRIITTQDLQVPNGVEIVNPNVYIASLTPSEYEDTFSMEILIGRGKGFVLACDLDSQIPDNFVPIDARFAPIERVSFKFEISRDFKKETLIFHIWTRGTISPDDAMGDASKILTATFLKLAYISGSSLGLLNVSTQVSDKTEKQKNIRTSYVHEEWEYKTSRLQLHKVPVRDLALSQRARNCLTRAGIKNLEQLTRFTWYELLELQGCGIKSAVEISKALMKRFKLRLRA